MYNDKYNIEYTKYQMAHMEIPAHVSKRNFIVNIILIFQYLCWYQGSQFYISTCRFGIQNFTKQLGTKLKLKIVAITIK